MKKAAISLLLAILGFAVPNWKEIDRLVSEQKLEEAAKAVAAIRAEARGRGDAGEETKALVREVQLREALHGYETAVRFLREEPWPKGARWPGGPEPLLRRRPRHVRPRLLVGDRPAREGRDERDRRPQGVDARPDLGGGGPGLRSPSGRSASRSEGRDVSTRSGVRRGERLPARRSAARCATRSSYLFVGFLADTAGWRPEQSNDLFALDRNALIAGKPGEVRPP